MTASRPETFDRPPGPYLRALLAWVSLVVRHPRLTLLLVAILTLASGIYALGAFRIDSDTGKLINKDAPFRKYYEDFTDAFPFYDESTLIVVSAETRPRARDSAAALAAELRKSQGLFNSIFVPSEGDFFDDHSLLYLDYEDLEKAVDRFSEAQPTLTALAEDPSLRGLAAELSDALDAAADGEILPGGFARISNRVSEIADGLHVGRAEALAWEDEFLEDDPGDWHELVVVQGAKDFEDSTPSKIQIDAIRGAAVRIGLVPEQGVRVRLTGMVPLEHEEMESLVSSIGLAGIVSFAALVAVMVFGLRSLRVVMATLFAVVVGVIWSLAFGLIAIGEYSTISMAFGVLLIGLGADFAIHLCLRYQEYLEVGESSREAMIKATAGVGTAVTLCALTSSIAFVSFVPTKYLGLADLGIVMGGGLMLALFASFTVTPAILGLGRAPLGRPVQFSFSTRLSSSLARRATSAGYAAALVAVAAAILATQITFDFSTLGTKDPESESMTTLAELHKEGTLTDYSVSILAPDWESASAMAERLSRLSSVEEVRTPHYHLPSNQDEKLDLLEDAQDFMWPVFRIFEPLPAPSADERRAVVIRLTEALAALKQDQADADSFAAAQRLDASLRQLLSGTSPDESLEKLESLVLFDFDEQLDWLQRALSIEAVEFDDLPAPLRERLVTKDGRVLISVMPREDVSEVRHLRTFVDQVAAVAPGSTGRAVVEAGIGQIVVGSFQQALAISFVAVLLLLAIALRDFFETVLVLIPIVLAALLTIASGVVFDLPFNMVNVVVIPLIMGLGVDNGIHIVMRHREGGNIHEVLQSSTPRAILLSGLTTLGAFGALSISTHLGIRSLGLLLSLSLLYLFVGTLLVLPALLAWLAAVRSRSPSTSEDGLGVCIDGKG